MDFDVVPTSNFTLPELVECLNQGFEDYLVPIQFNTATFLNMVRKDGIDLTVSRVLMMDDEPCGIAFLARRGWTSRLAAMGIARQARGQGAGSWFMNRLIKDARQRDEREMVLEVIEQNEPAVKLYRNAGFQTVRRLVGFIRKGSIRKAASDLEEIDLREMGKLVSLHGLSDLRWQLSGESIAQMNPPACAYQKGPAYIVISNPEAEHVVVWSLLVEQGARGQGLGADLLNTAIANHKRKTWHMPAILPEELGIVFQRAGFEREELSQWQMKLQL
jgi:ribosomal protein S18 acetylase RimI-like enzyme